MSKENIPTTIIKLPVTGKEVVVYNYLTTGEHRRLQKETIAGSKIDPLTGTVESISGDVLFDAQDLALSFLVKDFNREEIDNLPVEDGTLLYEKVQEIVNNSLLTKEAKKK